MWRGRVEPGKRTTLSGKSGMRIGFMPCVPLTPASADYYCQPMLLSAHQRESGLHFVPRMHLARILSHQNSLGQKFAGLLYFSDSREMLAKLEIPGDVTRIRV